MKAFFQNWLPWISSRLTRIDRKVPTFTTMQQTRLGVGSGKTYSMLFVIAHHGPMYGVHHTFSTN